MRRGVVAALVSSLLSVGATAAGLPALGKTETANVELVVRNLDDLVKSAGDLVKKKEGGGVWVPHNSQKTKVAALEDAAAYKAVLENLRRKLKGKNIHPIPGLGDKTDPKYSLGDPSDKSVKPGHPRAAYCVANTFVKIGGTWVRCPAGDIIVDGGILDPPANGGKPIDETTDEGWKQKWTLLHVLVHEKWHERMIDEQKELVKESNGKGWTEQPESEKKKKLDIAEKNGADTDAHAEVYKAQKRVLYLKWELLKRRAAKAKGEEKKKIEGQMKWLLDEIGNLEEAMKKALKDHSEFEFADCRGAGDLRNGTLAIYVVMGSGYWRMDVDLAGGRATAFRVPEALVFGTLHHEDAALSPPSLYVSMPQRIYTGLQVQPEPCNFLKWATGAGLIHRGPTFGSIADSLPHIASRAIGSTATLGLVLPRDVSASRPAAGSLTTDLHAYDDVPAVRVVPVRVTEPHDDLLIDAGGGPQTGDGPFAIRIPYDARSYDVRTLDPSDHSEIGGEVEVPLGFARFWNTPPSTGSPADYTTQPLCVRGALQAIWGPFNTRSEETRVSVDGIPAPIVAETSRAVYWRLPEGIGAGRHHLSVADGGRGAKFEVIVMSLEMSAEQLDLQAGQTTRYHIRLRLGEVPAGAWQKAFIPSDLVNLDALEAKTPAFHRPQPDGRGEIVLVLTNASPEVIRIADMPDNVRVFHLGAADFRDGVFAHDGVIQSTRSGGFVINGLALSALTPVAGEAEEVSDTPEARRIRRAYERLQEARRKYHQAIAKTEKALEDGQQTAPQQTLDDYEEALRNERKQWQEVVKTGSAYDAEKSDANKKAYDDAQKKLGELVDKRGEAKQKMIDAMSKEARKAYYDAEDAERQAGRELGEAQREMDKAITK